MKINKMYFAAAAFAFLLACGGSDSKTETTTTTSPSAETSSATSDLSANPDYQKGLALVAKSDCLTCHKVNEASTGPAYKEVAAKYANAADTTIDRLANTIIKGGSGQWGAIPMTPHPNVSIEDARQMVKYVLLLNQ